MLSLTIISSSNPLSTPFLHRHLFTPATTTTTGKLSSKLSPKYTSISAIIIPPSSSSSSYSSSKSTQQKQLYQPYRPPPSPLPSKFRKLDTNGRLEVLTNRLGLWFEYAPLIPSLIDEGFSSPLIEELTGITGIDQNRLVVAAQVRDSLVEETQSDSDLLAFFDSGGSELLYEIRLLSASQRVLAAQYAVDNQFDSKQTQDLAKAIKDKPRRKGDKGWESFDDELPGDCLGFMFYRQALEHKTASSVEAWKAALEKALEAVESETARKTVLLELEGKEEEEKDKAGVVDDGVRVPVVRMQLGEVAEATYVVVYPVCKADGKDGEVEEAPWEVVREGEFGVVEAEKGWSRWVVLPGWLPLAGLRRGGVAVEFKNSRFLPGKTHKWNSEEPILVVADRGQKEVVADGGFYLVVGSGNGSGEEGLKVVRGLVLKEMGINETLGTVVLVVRPPREDNDEQIKDEDWD